MQIRGKKNEDHNLCRNVAALSEKWNKLILQHTFRWQEVSNGRKMSYLSAEENPSEIKVNNILPLLLLHPHQQGVLCDSCTMDISTLFMNPGTSPANIKQLLSPEALAEKTLG